MSRKLPKFTDKTRARPGGHPENYENSQTKRTCKHETTKIAMDSAQSPVRHLDLATPAFYNYRKNPKCYHTVWGKMPPRKRFRKQTFFCTYRCGRKQSMNMSANHDHSTGNQTRSCSGSCPTQSSRVRINIDLVYPSLSHHRASHRARHTIFFLVRSRIAGSRWCKMYWHHSKQQNVNSHKCCTDFSMSENNA